MDVLSLNKKHLSNFIKQEAKKLGFYDCGISRADHLPYHEIKMENWINEGKHAEMAYLERNKAMRYNPKLLVDGAKSVISIIYNYYPNKVLCDTDNYTIAKYAYGTDYHYVIKNKLCELLDKINERHPHNNSRFFVDSAPVLDRAWAHKSGLGFIGKNTMLINKKIGSYFFIGHIITDIELDYHDKEPLKNYCGNCTKCIDSCPNNAITPNSIDSNKCISYLTIEHRGDLNNKKLNFEKNIFGCDICQDVCPWNRFATPHNEPLFDPSENLLSMKKEQWENIDKVRFKNLFKNSAVTRTRFKGLLRNIEYVKRQSDNM